MRESVCERAEGEGAAFSLVGVAVSLCLVSRIVAHTDVCEH
jgi:hypothetical protein